MIKELFNRSVWYIRKYGVYAFIRRAKQKLFGGADKDKGMPDAAALRPGPEASRSGSIWDNSSEQYEKGGFKIYWELLPEVTKYQNRCMVDDENANFLMYALDYLKRQGIAGKLKGLSIGCIEKGPEIGIFRTGLFDSLVIYDVAEGLLEKQKTFARENGFNEIEYIKQDCNLIQLKPNTYHFIWAVGTVHHIENLENLFTQINNALTENGIFAMREYIGPNRLQLTDLQVSLANELLSALPVKYRKTMHGTIKGKVQRGAVADIIRMDPSEAARSQDIMSVFREKLETIKISYTNGTLLHPLLGEIASNFEGDEDRDTVLKLLIKFDRILVERGVLPSDYVFCMARKKNSPQKISRD
jgi:SAM-dependent methyltransferase